MKFTTLFALIASASAAGNVNTQKLVLKDQMKSLQTMVQTAQTHKASDMISAITDRKADLEYQLALAGNSADKKGIARELTYLLDLVKNIEQNDFEGATKTLSHRKNKLFKYQMHLQEEEANAEEEPTAEGDAAEGDAAEGDAAEGDAAEGDAAEGDATEETTDGEAEAKSNTGAIIGGVAAAAIIVGGCVYMKKKNSEENEGGQKEDKKLFKSTFKGNVVKKVQKEALVPTFAVPAEENI